MKRIFTMSLAASVLAASMPSCGWIRGLIGRKKPAKVQEKPEKRLVGRIASVSADGKFVLIQSYGGWEVPVGSLLTTQAEGDRVSNLLTTGERLGQFAAADLQSGSPHVGDAVFHAPAQRQEATPDAEIPKGGRENIPPAPVPAPKPN